MTVKLNKSAFDHAQKLITDGHMVVDGRDAWSEHQPSAQRSSSCSRPRRRSTTT
ncbi:MAG: hypothetical protein ACJ8CR_12460 [Roseiflexaceae bacterium]